MDAAFFRLLADLAGETGCEVYAVGGFVRDRLLGRKAKDLDLAAKGNVAAFAARVAERTGGTLVPLDPEHQTWRIALKNGDRPTGEWVDVAGYRAPTIEADLAGRDFTVNAMALPLGPLAEPSGASEDPEAGLVDPLGGRDDLRNRRVRMVSAQNLDDDPLRVLRAVRTAAEIGGAIDPATADACAARAERLTEPAPERTREELMRLFESAAPGRWVRELDRLRLLPILFPELAACRGVTQNAFHHLDVFDHSLLTLEVASRLTRSARRHFAPDAAAIRASMDAPLADSTMGTYVKLVSLLHDVAKPTCRTIEPDGRVRFIGHDLEGERMVVTWAERWRFPSDAVRALGAWVRHHLRAGHLSGDDGPTRRTAYRFYRDLGPLADGAIVLSWADRMGARGGDFRAVRRAQLASLRELLRIRREELSKPPKVRFVTGSDLMRELQLAPGPEIGRLLAAVDEAAALGEVTDAPSALALARRLIASPQQKSPSPLRGEGRGEGDL